MGICHGAGGEQRAGWGSRCGSAVAEWETLGAVRASEKEARVPGGTGFGVRHVSEERVSGSRNSVLPHQGSTQAGIAGHGCYGEWRTRSLRTELSKQRHWGFNLGAVQFVGYI